jgi:TonB family protein
MFESLMASRSQRGVVQPALSFAIHAGLILLVVSKVPGEISTVGNPSQDNGVIYVPAYPRTGTQLPVEDASPIVAAPVLPGLPVTLAPIPGDLPSPVRIDPLGGMVSQLPVGVFDRLPSVGSEPGGEIYQETDLTDSPVLLHFPRPQYPAGLRLAGMGGSVVVSYVIDATGRVEMGSVSIVFADHPALAESVRASLVEVAFRPGRIRGNPVRTLVRQTIRFVSTPAE